jgi:hypothetical protein
MGGHQAWRKRLANGELAKGFSGAICRHRAHLGRKGKDLIKNRKGHIGLGNPKKLKSRAKKLESRTVEKVDNDEKDELVIEPNRNLSSRVLGTTCLLVLLSLLYSLLASKRNVG